MPRDQSHTQNTLYYFFNLKITNRSFKWTFNICTFIFSSCAYFFFLLAHFHLIIFLPKPHLQKSSMCLHMKTRLFILSIVAITCQQIRVMPPCCLRKPHNEMVKKNNSSWLLATPGNVRLQFPKNHILYLINNLIMFTHNQICQVSEFNKVRATSKTVSLMLSNRIKNSSVY